MFALLIGGFAWESAKEAEDALAEITYELVLEEGLAGYREYEQQVPYRLIPFIW